MTLQIFFEYIIYFLVIIPLINEYLFIFDTDNILKAYVKLDSKIELEEHEYIKTFSLLSFIVAVLGLFSAQGFLFLLYFLSGFIPPIIEYKFPKIKTNKIFFKIDGIICMLLLLLILLNRFYLHYDFTKYFMMWIGPENYHQI